MTRRRSVAPVVVRPTPEEVEQREDIAREVEARLRELLTLESPTAAEAEECVYLLLAFHLHTARWFPEPHEVLRRGLFVRSLFAARAVVHHYRRTIDRVRDRWLDLARRDPVGCVAMMRDHTVGRAVFDVGCHGVAA